MGRKAKDLSPLEISRLAKPGNHAVGSVSGLYLYVNDTGARSWILRFMVGGKRRHMGLGGYPDVSVADARVRARAARETVRGGEDPILLRRRSAQELRARQETTKTFDQSAADYITAHGTSWKNAKHKTQWKNTLKTYASPVIGALSVQDITQHHVLKILEPIWTKKNETASRLRGRIESVLDWASARQYRTGENPARWKGFLDKLLPPPSRVQKVIHHPAVSLNDLPGVMQALAVKEGISIRALEFTVLTAARSGEVRGATWNEIDLTQRLWNVPASRMKAGKDHSIPLNEYAISVLKKVQTESESGLIFPNAKGAQLSDMALTQILRRLGVDAVPHGFRSTFRDWAGELTDYPRELAEQALAHETGNKVEAAYRRGQAIEKRRAMMEAWSAFCYQGVTN